MVTFSIIMIIISAIISICGFLLYMGKTQLLREYQQRIPKNKYAYAKALGKALLIMALFPFASGIIGLLGNTKVILVSSILLFFVGIIIGLYCILHVEEKLSKGKY